MLTDAELVAVYRAAMEMGHPFGYMILLCIHCAFRIGEVAGMKWSYITKDYFTIPAEVYKTGREHILPNLLGENLALVPKVSEYLFPSRRGTPITSYQLLQAPAR